MCYCYHLFTQKHVFPLIKIKSCYSLVYKEKNVHYCIIRMSDRLIADIVLMAEEYYSV